ncbi:Long-chain-acyl-CoA dehydrogenase [Sphingobium chlorophenolicum L-1]|uniref:Long-chain-acyl-CoA dehydrogenase n=1 Tax=Sphingobium chlorophenolicum L-1 TaxID=690566 RepID=F6EUI5_SPHCR|nr:acyl-CoA dehydrogenase family protein [Sphingobium chlorophenolicum]AEG47879.1 Long-chain-acyl-CoA dehydrogenase [Sphingobium chlorophenolicum L-1]
MSELDLSHADIFEDEEVAMFEHSVLGFIDRFAKPEDAERWRKNKQVDRSVWVEAAKAGLLGVSVPPEYGGAGGDLRHEIVITKELGHACADALTISLHNAVIIPYFVSFGTEEQKQRWLPPMCTGEYILAIAMTEPGAGSDLQGMKMSARKTEGGYLLNGQKTFISNGQIANLILVAAKTDTQAGSKGISLFIVDTEQAGDSFRRGRNLEKVGQEGQDTSELYFDDVFVPDDCVLGGAPGLGMGQLMAKLPQERLVIAWQAMAMIERAVAETIAYVRDRKMFGQALIDFQNTQFKLAEIKTTATIARVFLDHCTRLQLDGKLDASTASMAKYWISDRASEIIDECLQFFGGYGYMLEYPIARLYRDSRIHRIYGGANEVMKLLIARSL